MTVADYTCTIYQLFLGNQLEPSGWFQRGYTEAMLSVLIVPKNSVQTLTLLGTYTGYTNTGFTRYECYEGDVIKDAINKTWYINSVTPWYNGDVFLFNVLDLEYLPNFVVPTSSERFFGFEDATHGTIGSMFEDGFERGYWTELT